MESLVLEHFLDDAERARILAHVRAADSAQAGVYGAPTAIDRRVRSAQLVTVGDEIGARLRELLASAQDTLAKEFEVTLTNFEEPQFLRYLPGDFFVAHQDGNTDVIHDDTRHRRISIVIFLNEASDEPRDGTYGGGALTLFARYPDWDRRTVMPPLPGALVAFRSETTHEVTPVTHGERYTIVSWYRQEGSLDGRR